jgi:replicative DNA helicase
MIDAARSANKKVSQGDFLKIPPQAVEAEQAVLGGLMLDNQSWEKVGEILRAEDFYRPDHKIVFSVLQSLASRNKPYDILTVKEALKDFKQLDQMGGEAYLFELVHNTPSAANIQAYAEIVHEKSVLRQVIEAGTKMIASAYVPLEKTASTLLDEAEREVFHIAENYSKHGNGPVKVDSLLKKAVEHIDKLYHSDSNITGISTGYMDLDNMTSGLQPADLIVIAGRPSMGKTALAMNIAEHTAIKTSQPVLVFSMEMPGESLAIRMMSSLGRIDQHRMRSGKLEDADWPRIQSAVNMLSETKLFIDDTPALNPMELRSRARRVAREHGNIGLIVVDYLQLMQAEGHRDNRVAEISEISRSLKTLAKELHVPVIALSQLNRGLEQRQDKKPVMSDLRESGAIEQDADVIIFIYRDEVYNKDSKDKGIAEIIISKQRNGPIGMVKLTFLGKHTKFENYLPETFVPQYPE